MPSDPESPSPKPARSPSADADSKSPPEASSSSTPAPAPEPAPAAAASAADWQAVWSPPHNAYYFFNSRTQETTWVNPLQPPAEDASADAAALVPAAAELPVASTSARPVAQHDPYAAALAAGIDPELAHLDPSLALPSLTPSGPMSFAAKFNARTGAFAKMDSRTPDHLSEFERARRMSGMYFDVEKWEQEVAERKAQEREDELNGKKRKRPSKKDLVSPPFSERFKEQKKRKTIAKTAWLRS
ncbi:hypothetical protein EXIGLDRAFT_609743 [Exidia glandulosa HHB12029]|uniref:WW domain-containing protein n=1 Tax=Exidia glandulosa HHB12029 TaxID=1314781 RepID=A0A166AXB2_EXIGL|nr:hypothetical protein EXIGLDRAFT_609743 [Exidia glandulosa HHB12029]